MPIQAPHWMEFLSCPICCHEFSFEQRCPVSLGCSHTVCQTCLSKLQRNQCPYDQNVTSLPLEKLPVNYALLSLLSSDDETHNYNCDSAPPIVSSEFSQHYISAMKDLKQLALLLKPFAKAGNGMNGNVICVLSRPMQRKLVSLINCQLVEEEGRLRAVRAARSLGERSVTELILHHQNHHQLSSNLWAAVRSRGCQFLGPAMQEEVLKLVLLALEDGSALSRKVLVMFVVQRLEPHFPQASKTSIGHVVQLLYRASCFMVHKRESDSSLMQLKEEFRTYDALRREHDAQIVQIATEAGLRIAPDQWSSLLYGDMVHKSHMQSIMDKLQTPQSFGQSVQELIIALQRTGDPGHLFSLKEPLEALSILDTGQDSSDGCDWAVTESSLRAVKEVVLGLVSFIKVHGNRKLTDSNFHFGAKFKTSFCRDLSQSGSCPRGGDCTFAHNEVELARFRSRNRRQMKSQSGNPPPLTVSSEHELNNMSQGDIIRTEIDQSSSDPHSHHQLNTCQHSVDQNDNSDCSLPPNKTNFNAPSTTETHLPAPVHGTGFPTTATKAMVPLLNKGAPLPRFEDSEGGRIPPSQYPPFQLIEPHSSLPRQNAPLQVVTPVEATSFIRHPIPPITSPRPPIYAAMLPEYTYQMFHSQTPMFATQPTPTGVPASPVLHPVSGQLTNVYSSPQILPAEVISPSPQPPVLINQGHVVGVFGPSQEFAVASGLPTAIPPPTVAELPLGSQWNELLSQEPNRNVVKPSNDITDTALSNRSLVELTERKEELLCRLTDIVGEEAMDEINSQIVKGKPLKTNDKYLGEFSSTYCIWTSGADFSHITRPKVMNNDKDREWSLGCRRENNERDHRDYRQKSDLSSLNEGGFLELPSSSSLTKSFQPPLNPIQVSACNTTDPITTPIVYRPVPAISPMPQMLFQPMTAFVIRPSIDAMNTIGHGIIDPPHLHMSQLEPSGARPSDPISDFLPIEEEERQRQQFIAAKENCGASEDLTQKLEEMKLKAELNRVMQGITEKKKELRENERGVNTRHHQFDFIQGDEFDFDRNWTFGLHNRDRSPTEVDCVPLRRSE